MIIGHKKTKKEKNLEDELKKWIENYHYSEKEGKRICMEQIKKTVRELDKC